VELLLNGFFAQRNQPERRAAKAFRNAYFLRERGGFAS
jgi:hypothetical protein